jgi:hypothetical protein
MKESDVHETVFKIAQFAHGKLSPDYDPEKDKLSQAIFRSHELSIADYLMSHKDDLVKDFMKDYPSLKDAVFAQCRNVMDVNKNRKDDNFLTPDTEGTRFHPVITNLVRKQISKDESIVNTNGWKNLEFKYHSKNPDQLFDWEMDKEFCKTNYPTAHKLITEFGKDCPIASYSVLGPKTVLHRHTGPENREGKYIRIHIPLIIPKGDLFFEVNGEEITWDDIFGFDNQFVHSAYNLSNKYRLIFLIDISRKRLGLPKGTPWSKDRQLYALSKPFIRKQKNHK